MSTSSIELTTKNEEPTTEQSSTSEDAVITDSTISNIVTEPSLTTSTASSNSDFVTTDSLQTSTIILQTTNTDLTPNEETTIQTQTATEDKSTNQITDDSGISTEATKPSDTSTTFTTDGIYSTTIAGSTETTSEVPICPPGVFGNIPHPTLCDSFYLCAGGVPIQLFCSYGFEFDATVGVSILN